jgi:hypothetical protein
VSPRHRDGPGDKAEFRVHAHCAGDAHADAVLDHRQDGSDEPEDHDLRAAALEEHQRGAQADGCEERDHERRLEQRVEFDDQHVGLAQDQGEDREGEAADDGGGDVEAVEHAHAAPDAVADEEDHGGQRHGLDHVEFECRHKAMA